MSELTKVPDKYKNKNIYSPSKLQTYERCQYSYYLGYILRLKGKDNVYNLLGGEIHLLLLKLQNKTIDNDTAIKQFKNKLLEIELLDLQFPSEKVAKNFEECIIHYLKCYQPIQVKKIKMEKEIYVEILSFVMRMIIDVIILNFDDTIEILDYKSSSMYSESEMIKYARQLILYAIGVEEVYKSKVSKIKWNFLKYALVEYEVQLKKGTKWKNKIIQRNKIIKTFYNDMFEQLKALNIPQFEAEIILEKVQKINEIPEQLKSFYKISNAYIEYPYNDEIKKELIDFINNTILEIESKKDEKEFEPIEIDQKNSFFCSVLCSQRNNCKYYDEFLMMNKDNFNKKDKEKVQELIELFG